MSGYHNSQAVAAIHVPLAHAARRLSQHITCAPVKSQGSFYFYFLGGKAIHRNTNVAKEPQGQCLVYVLTSNK